MSVKGKRKMKSWGYLSTAPARGGDSSSPQQMKEALITSIKNRIKEEMEKDDTLHDWQEFVFRRQEKIDRKLQSDDIYSEHSSIKNQVNELLEGQPAQVSDAVTMLVLSATYIHYNKGLSDGMKIGMIVGNV